MKVECIVKKYTGERVVSEPDTVIVHVFTKIVLCFFLVFCSSLNLFSFSCAKEGGESAGMNCSVTDGCEYKLLLKAERFLNPPEGMKDYLKIVCRTADELNMCMSFSDRCKPEKERFISFHDTPSFDLRKKGYILRERMDVKGDNRGGRRKRELTLKFRSMDADTAGNSRVDPSVNAGREVTFEEDILIKNMTVKKVYSKSGKVEIEGPLPVDILSLSKLFPGVSSLAISNSPLVPVRDLLIREIRIKPGNIKFDTVDAPVTITVWIDERKGKTLAGEFSFRLRAGDRNTVSPVGIMRANELADRFIKKLAANSAMWLMEGMTKTGIVYGEAGEESEE